MTGSSIPLSAGASAFVVVSATASGLTLVNSVPLNSSFSVDLS
jgi:hypothetical protein